jgi:4'-phosphopantetheinyl transferase
VREIAVWMVHLDGLPTDGALLDDEERRRWLRLRTAGLRDTFAAAHWVRRMILAENLGTDPAGLRFTSGRWGKPELADRALFHSFSHSRDMAMVAVSATDPVGVDIEAVRGDLPATRLARTFFRPSEARTVESAMDRAAHYIRLWTRKEAAGKVTGICLDRTLRIDVDGEGPRRVDLEHVDGSGAMARVIDVAAPDGFLAAAAMLGEEPFTVRRSTCSWASAMSA